MTDQGQRFGPEQDNADDAAQAFEALRRAVERMAREVGGEMTIIRKGVEAAFDHFDKYQQPPNYTEEILQLAKQAQNVGKKLAALERSPAMKIGPHEFAQLLERAAVRLTESTKGVLEQRERSFERIRADMAESIRSARVRQDQNRWLWGAGAAGLVVGALLTVFMPRILPGSVDAAIASTVMGGDRWNAGISLLRSASPDDWNNLARANSLVRENRAALTTCAEAAAKAKKDQSCTITVAVPAQQ